jgi:hypothetical protein
LPYDYLTIDEHNCISKSESNQESTKRSSRLSHSSA